MTDYSTLLPAIIATARGATIMEVYATDFAVDRKEDDSPVTEADTRAEAIIIPALKALTPDYPIVAEEAASRGELPKVGDAPFWLVDPLDGTKEFLNRNGEFTVNIALIVNRVPVLGVIYAPALGVTYTGVAGAGATRTADGAATAPIAVSVSTTGTVRIPILSSTLPIVKPSMPFSTTIEDRPRERLVGSVTQKTV